MPEVVPSGPREGDSVSYTDLLPALSSQEYEALKADIAERGCLVPIELDENGRVLDGAHRRRACEELGIRSPTITRPGLTDEEKRAHAIALNLRRRQLTRDQRQGLHRELRSLGKSLREIADASGVDEGTVRNDLRAGAENSAPATKSAQSGLITGRDGKTYPATRPKPKPVVDIPDAQTAANVREVVDEKRTGRMTVHYSSQTDEWATPQDFFDALHAEFGFELDVCALASSAKCERYFAPEDDGLAQGDANDNAGMVVLPVGKLREVHARLARVDANHFECRRGTHPTKGIAAPAWKWLEMVRLIRKDG